MNRKTIFLPSMLLLLSFVLSACIGLIPLEEEPVTGEFGPKTSLQDQQTKTFEAIWKNLEDNYIYFETANVEWDGLHDKYLGRIKSGLTADEFTGLIQDLEAELPEGSLLMSPGQNEFKQTPQIPPPMETTLSFAGLADCSTELATSSRRSRLRSSPHWRSRSCEPSRRGLAPTHERCTSLRCRSCERRRPAIRC